MSRVSTDTQDKFLALSYCKNQKEKWSLHTMAQGKNFTPRQELGKKKTVPKQD